MITAYDIFEVAKTYRGVPWKHQGRSRSGVDCLGLVIRVALDLEIEGAEKVFEYDGRQYSRITPLGLCKELIKGGLVRARFPVPGGVVLIGGEGTYPSHLGILGATVSELEMIHAHAPDRRVIHHGFDERWRRSARAFFTYPGVIYG
jgi:hypothetical protein